MEVKESSPRFKAAMNDFRRARQRGALESIMARLSGKSSRLVPYEEIPEELRRSEPIRRGRQMIPLDAIVGSVGRYTDFTRSFLPRQKYGQKRWARVRSAFDNVHDMPPILVYKVGDSYFVLDGNHRVSVAHVLGAHEIPAYVTEVETRVPLSPDVEPDELICQAQYATFLAKTNLDELRPQADLTVTAPGQYRVLLEQIDRYWAWLCRERGQDVPYSQAVAGWYDDVYRPLVDVIRRRGLLRAFPKRTETDLYAWVVKHREDLEEELGWEVDTASAAQDLIQRFSPDPQQLFSRVKERVLGVLTPDRLEAGPRPGQWREEVLGPGHEENLFCDLLVPVAPAEGGLDVLEQALLVAQRESGRVHGLHVLRDEREGDQSHLHPLQEAFDARCAAAGVDGELTVETGPVSQTICDHAYWNDLVVVGLSHLPGPHLTERLSSGFSTLVRRCGRPVLAVPGSVSPLENLLLAYDGSPKAKEALFVAAYLAGKWQRPLTVVSVAGERSAERSAAETLTHARQYLQSRRVHAFYLLERGDAASALQRAAEARGSDLIIMGGYGFRPLLEVILGSTVDEVLRWRRWPVLICR
jgi:nucleotide-binding universal stress UspA family protein